MRSLFSMRLGLLALVASTGWAREFTLGDCKAALQGLSRFPGNTSLPFLAAATGHFDLGFSFQNKLVSVLPSKVFGMYDMCQTPQLYSYDAVKTHFCTLGFDKTGICVPEQCTEDVLRSQIGNMEFTTFLVMLGVNATMAMPPPCAFDPLVTPVCARFLAAKDYYENLYQNFMIFAPSGIACDGRPTEAQTGNKIMIGVTVILILLCAVGTMCGSWRRSAKKLEGITRVPAGQSIISPRLPEIGVPPSSRQVAIPRDPPALFKAFDLHDNLHEIFSLNVRPGEFSCFDGLRAISCGWVVLYHVILWQTRWINNPDALLPPNGLLGQWWAQPMFNFSGTLCVDTFLFISAFLAMFLLLKKLEREKRSVFSWMPMTYFHRFLRITPAYMFALFANWKLAPLVSSGPMARQLWANDHRNCPDQWWRHLLYINTVSPWDANRRNPQCFGHTWYLADDMMFFYTVPIMAFFYSRGGVAGKAFSILLTLTIIIGCMSWAGTQAYQKEWSPNTWDGDAAARFQREAFEVPWGRAPSYFIGIMVAFVWYEKKRIAPTWRFPLPLAALMVLVASTLMVAVIYGPATGSVGITDCIVHPDNPNCGSHWPRHVKVLLAFAARPAWTTGLSLMCLLCFSGQGGPVNHILSSAIWSPFSFLSYTVYLVHYTVLNFYMANLTQRIHWEFFEFVVIYLGITAMAHIYATVVAVLVEKPAMKLQKAWFEPAAAKKAAPQGSSTKAVELLAK